MEIIYEKKDRIAYITINRPEVMNAITPKAVEELGKVWIDFRDDDDLWVSVITGAGDKAFCAGADLKELILCFVTFLRKAGNSSFSIPVFKMRGKCESKCLTYNMISHSYR